MGQLRLSMPRAVTMITAASTLLWYSTFPAVACELQLERDMPRAVTMITAAST